MWSRQMISNANLIIGVLNVFTIREFTTKQKLRSLPSLEKPLLGCHINCFIQLLTLQEQLSYKD